MKPAEGLSARHLRIVMTPQENVTVGILSVECKLTGGAVWPDTPDQQSHTEDRIR